MQKHWGVRKTKHLHCTMISTNDFESLTVVFFYFRKQQKRWNSKTLCCKNNALTVLAVCVFHQTIARMLVDWPRYHFRGPVLLSIFHRGSSLPGKGIRWMEEETPSFCFNRLRWRCPCLFALPWRRLSSPCTNKARGGSHSVSPQAPSISFKWMPDGNWVLRRRRNPSRSSRRSSVLLVVVATHVRYCSLLRCSSM